MPKGKPNASDPLPLVYHIPSVCDQYHQLDRSGAISYSIPKIEHDPHLSPADAGGILGAFGLGYAITTLLGGIVVGRFWSRSVLAVPWLTDLSALHSTDLRLMSLLGPETLLAEMKQQRGRLNDLFEVGVGRLFWKSRPKRGPARRELCSRHARFMRSW
jgi:hypothetical protein